MKYKILGWIIISLIFLQIILLFRNNEELRFHKLKVSNISKTVIESLREGSPITITDTSKIKSIIYLLYKSRKTKIYYNKIEHLYTLKVYFKSNEEYIFDILRTFENRYFLVLNNGNDYENNELITFIRESFPQQ